MFTTAGLTLSTATTMALRRRDSFAAAFASFKPIVAARSKSAMLHRRCHIFITR
jgi:hypothetical protein